MTYGGPHDPDFREADSAFLNESDDEVVEIDADGRIYTRGGAPRAGDNKPNILRDPQGEYVK
jgi:hypothetical protein